MRVNTADLSSIPSADSTSTPPPTEVEPEPAASTEALHDKLLRLHKDVAWIPSYKNLHETYINLIDPLFEASDVITQALVLLPSDTIAACNAALRAAESEQWKHQAQSSLAVHPSPRPPKRHGLYLSTSDPYGLLIEDMSADPTRGEVMFELKPKWLAQSPNAPADAKRCRTCALKAFRRSKQAHETAQKQQQPSGAPSAAPDFCPLDLMPDAEATASEPLRQLVLSLVSSHPQVPADAQPDLATSLAATLAQSPVLRRLRTLQLQLDPAGVLAISDAAPSDEFLVATTLRDCTLFVKLRRDAAGSVQVAAKLGDLDLKVAETGKLEYWQRTERDLIDGGWYQGRDGTVVGCRLERAA